MSAEVVQDRVDNMQSWKLPALCSFGAALGGVYLGASLVDPFTGVIVGLGVLASWCVGIFLVAPLAAKKSYQRITGALKNPTPEDQEMIQNLSINLVGNMSQIAQHEEGQKLIKPIFNVAMQTLDEGIDKTFANLKSQASKGIGAFSDNGGDAKQIVSELVMPTIDGLLDSFGATDSLKQKIHVKLAAKMSGGLETGNQPAVGGGWG
jgi:hypothetical protein